MSITTNTEKITPEIARAYLGMSIGNRSISEKQVKMLSRAMRDGQFRTTHQGIAFTNDGGLYDGHHRLRAIVECGTPQLIRVTRGVPCEDIGPTDEGMRVRTVSDSLTMQGEPYSSKRNVATVRLWMLLKNGITKPARHEILDFLRAHVDAIAFAESQSQNHQILRHSCVQVILAAGYEAGHGDELKKWCEVVHTGFPTEPWHTSALRFRDQMMVEMVGVGGQAKRVDFCRKAFSSMLAWVERRGLAKLYARDRIDWIEPGAAAGE